MHRKVVLVDLQFYITWDSYITRNQTEIEFFIF